MKNLIKRNYIYFILFIIYMLSFLIIIPLDYDEVWNYGFSISMADGLLPYRDFNMVMTPFFNFLISLPFHIFGKSIVVFYIEGAIIFVATTYFLFKLIDDKTWLIVAILFGGLAEIFPNYNFFCYFLLVLIIYLEKKDNVDKFDYLIGLLVSLTILSKQTIGCFMLIPCIFIVLKEKKRILKRIVGIVIPLLVFFIYLLITKTFFEFIDLCFLGMFDFAENNTYFNFIIIFLSILVISICICIKNKNKKTNYYILAFYVIGIPIFDLNHIEFVIVAFFILLFDNIKINNITNKIIKYSSISIIFIVFGMLFFSVTDFNLNYYPNKIKYFEFKYFNKDQLKVIDKINKKIKQYDINNIVFIGGVEVYSLKIQHDTKIDYMDMINRGNWGINRHKKQLEYINRNKNKFYFVETRELKITSDGGQVDKDLIKYVINNAKKIDSVEFYDIYVFK